MGTATYKIRKYPGTMIKDGGAGITLLEIAAILSNMPPNTVISSIRTLPVQDLALIFEIELTNPIFKDGGEIVDESEYLRSIGFDRSGKIIEYNNNLDFNLENVVRSHDDLELERKEDESEQ